MKAFYIPVSVLTALLLLSLWGSAYIQNRTDGWITAVESLSIPSEDEHWNKIESRLLAVHKDWTDSQTVFHLILEHEDLDEAEKYFSGALASCREKDRVELSIHLAQLISQFGYLGDTQEVTLKNIL